MDQEIVQEKDLNHVTHSHADKKNSKHRATSDILKEIAQEQKPMLTIRELCDRFGDRGFGIILFLFALPNCIPLPLPGISTITSVPMMFFSVQLCIGRNNMWLPHWMAKREVTMSSFQPFMHKAIPYLLKAEKYIKPRIDAINGRSFERLAGLLITIMVCLLVLPIPLGNLPLGIAVAALSLAIIERDGILMIIGWILTALALTYMTLLLGGYAWAFLKIIENIF